MMFLKLPAVVIEFMSEFKGGPLLKIAGVMILTCVSFMALALDTVIYFTMARIIGVAQ